MILLFVLLTRGYIESKGVGESGLKTIKNKIPANKKPGRRRFLIAVYNIPC